MRCSQAIATACVVAAAAALGAPAQAAMFVFDLAGPNVSGTIALTYEGKP
jgi:hypothetical protein